MQHDPRARELREFDLNDDGSASMDEVEAAYKWRPLSYHRPEEEDYYGESMVGHPSASLHNHYDEGQGYRGDQGMGFQPRDEAGFGAYHWGHDWGDEL